MQKGRLEGVRVLVTRPRERAQELCFLLEDEGAEVVAMPLLELQPPDDARPLRSAAEQLQRYRWVLFASPSAVQALVEASREAGTLNRFAQVKVAVVGPATARASRQHGLVVAAEAEQSTGLGLYEAIAADLQPGDEVLLPAAQDGREELHRALEEHGARTSRVAAYKSEARPIDPAELDALVRRPPDVVLFGSPRTAEAFLDACGERGRTLLASAKVVAIGPTTAAALEGLGVPPAAVAEKPTPSALVEAAIRAVRR